MLQEVIVEYIRHYLKGNVLTLRIIFHLGAQQIIIKHLSTQAELLILNFLMCS
jgi:hypothetical protein